MLIARFRPLVVAVVLAAALTVVLFLVTAVSVPAVAGVGQVGAGPLVFFRVTHEATGDASVVSATPGWGLLMLWLLLLGYGVLRAVQVERSGRPGG